MFSAAIFDMDGLLVDSERAIMNTWIAVALEVRPVGAVRISDKRPFKCGR